MRCVGKQDKTNENCIGDGVDRRTAPDQGEEPTSAEVSDTQAKWGFSRGLVLELICSGQSGL